MGLGFRVIMSLGIVMIAVFEYCAIMLVILLSILLILTVALVLTAVTGIICGY